MDSVREGEGGKIWENGIETCKISCRLGNQEVKRIVAPHTIILRDPLKKITFLFSVALDSADPR